MLQNYLACGTNSSETIDFYALNAYEWCGQSSYSVSGYNALTANITSYNVPIFFSETGCNTPKPRTFDDQAAIFGDDMTPYWSGAIIYEWIQEANDYGLVSYGDKVDPASPSAPPDGYPRSGTPSPISPDFPNLSKHWATLNPTGVKESNYKPSLTPPPCPEFTAGVWEVNGDKALPTLGASLDSSLKSSITAAATAVQTGNPTGASATASKTGGAAGMVKKSGEREVKGMVLGLLGLLGGVFVWL
jgi:1,3-beta-glucanosyltransferase GAS1